LYLQNTRGMKAIAAFDFDHAETAATALTQPIQVAERRDLDAVFTQDSEQRLPFLGGNSLVIDCQCHNRHSISSIRLSPRKVATCVSAAKEAR
jgi:hypothetical protein